MPDDFLRKQAWDYFVLHAGQRLTVFNFYIVISSVTATAYFSSFKIDSNLQHARPFSAVWPLYSGNWSNGRSCS